MVKKLFLLALLPLFLLSCFRDKGADTGKIDSNLKLQDYLLSGWNTWDNANLLNFVYMPEGLSLRLTFRSQDRSYFPHFLDHAFISGPLQNFPGKITPLAHSYDGRYMDMMLSWNGLNARIQVAREKRDVMILYTPVEVPEVSPLLILETGILYNRPGKVVKNKNIIQADVKQKTFNVQATSEELNIPLALSSPYFCMRADKETAFFTGYGRSLENIKEYVETRRKIYEEQQAKYGDLQEAYSAMRNLLGWNIIYDAFNNRSITPVSRTWNENWGGFVLFDWDTYFTSAMYALNDKFNAYSNAIAITKSITPGGFIPNWTGGLETKASFDRSQPPVGSMICKLIYEKYQDKWFLSEVYKELITWNRWWDKARNNNGYLSWGSDPLEKGTDNNNKQAAMFESGLDNSPLFDDAVFNEKTHKLDLASVDLMSFYITDCKALAFIAGELGFEADKAELTDRAVKYSSKLNELWDEKTGIYRDKNLVTNEFSKHLAPCNFYPLLAGVPTQQQAERMISEHFMNPQEFYGDFMLPSIARNDPGFPDNEYWRGRIWAPMNFLVYMGLRNYDLPEARKILSEKSLKLLMKEWKENNRVHENYNSVTGVGGDVKSSDSFYSWGGLLALIPLMEEGYW